MVVLLRQPVTGTGRSQQTSNHDAMYMQVSILKQNPTIEVEGVCVLHRCWESQGLCHMAGGSNVEAGDREHLGRCAGSGYVKT